MATCPFCRIVAGDAPAELVHRAAGAVAFLDAHPSARAHVLVVPRPHAATLLELDDAAVRDLFLAVKEVQRRIAAVLRPAGFNVGWNHGHAAGQRVPHLHVHVLPRYADGGYGIQALGTGGDPDALPELGAALRAVGPAP